MPFQCTHTKASVARTVPATPPPIGSPFLVNVSLKAMPESMAGRPSVGTMYLRKRVNSVPVQSSETPKTRSSIGLSPHGYFAIATEMSGRDTIPSTS